MAKVQLFRETNGYSVYIDGEEESKGKFQYFASHFSGVTLQTERLGGNSGIPYDSNPLIVAEAYAQTKAKELGVQVQDFTNIEPAEFILEERLAASAQSQPSCIKVEGPLKKALSNLSQLDEELSRGK